MLGVRYQAGAHVIDDGRQHMVGGQEAEGLVSDSSADQGGGISLIELHRRIKHEYEFGGRSRSATKPVSAGSLDAESQVVVVIIHLGSRSCNHEHV